MTGPRPDPADLAALEALVAAERWRGRLLADVQPDPERVAAGWERRFIADGERVRETVALYERLGFEVAADPLRAEEMPAGCDQCVIATLLTLRTIYTRRPPREEPAS